MRRLSQGDPLHPEEKKPKEPINTEEGKEKGEPIFYLQERKPAAEEAARAPL